MFYSFLLGFILFFTAVQTVEANSCNLETVFINQDPYPAVPGEEVKVLFQIKGVENANCGQVSVSFREEFPFSLSPDSQQRVEINAGTFTRDFNSFLMVPYKLRVSSDAKEGENRLRLSVSHSGASSQIKDFYVEVQEVQTEFEIFVRDYNPNDGTLTLEIINVGKNDVESLVVEILDQDALSVRGSARQTVGILDSNEDTTVRFRVDNVKEGDVSVNIRYNDQINERREITRVLYLNPVLFEVEEDNGLEFSTIVILVLVILIVGYWFYKRHERKKRLRERRNK